MNFVGIYIQKSGLESKKMNIIKKIVIKPIKR